MIMYSQKEILEKYGHIELTLLTTGRTQFIDHTGRNHDRIWYQYGDLNIGLYGSLDFRSERNSKLEDQMMVFELMDLLDYINLST